MLAYVFMTTAKCQRCGASATGGTLEEATLLLNHAVGLSRGIPCGDNYNCVEEIVTDTIVPESSTQEETPKVDIPEPVSSEASYQKVEGKSNENVEFDESKQSRKKSKKFSY